MTIVKEDYIKNFGESILDTLIGKCDLYFLSKVYSKVHINTIVIDRININDSIRNKLKE